MIRHILNYEDLKQLLAQNLNLDFNHNNFILSENILDTPKQNINKTILVSDGIITHSKTYSTRFDENGIEIESVSVDKCFYHDGTQKSEKIITLKNVILNEKPFQIKTTYAYLNNKEGQRSKFSYINETISPKYEITSIYGEDSINGKPYKSKDFDFETELVAIKKYDDECNVSEISYLRFPSPQDLDLEEIFGENYVLDKYKELFDIL